VADTVRTVEYFYAKVFDRPGEGRRLLEHLSEKGVNLISFTAFPVAADQVQIDFVPENVDLLLSAAADAGVDLVGPKKAFMIQGDDRIGALHDHHLKLSNAGINVIAANGATDGSGRFGYILWVRPEDVEEAARALGA
jgi:hypothetical protein